VSYCQKRYQDDVAQIWFHNSRAIDNLNSKINGTWLGLVNHGSKLHKTGCLHLIGLKTVYPIFHIIFSRRLVLETVIIENVSKRLFTFNWCLVNLTMLQ
jgi:hypothetical protein